jgi:Cu+-exporting ATPase
MVGAGEASRRGILVKSAADLEAAGRIRSVAFDKTGTLTLGRPTLGEIELLADGGFSDADVLRLAASAESASEHPIGRAIVESAKARGITTMPVTGFASTAGVGVRAVVEHRVVEVVRDDQASCRVVVDGVDVARLRVVDRPRPDAAATIDRLRRQGIRIRMITGDRRDAAIALGRELGLSPAEIVADATPESKLELIAAAGTETAMVGDGINDAAALARATLGIAMAGGTGAAIESAGVVVPADRVGGVADAIDLAKRTLATIRQNLALAFLYNSLAIPAAAFGLLGVHGPLIAAGAMAFSDVSVIGNALRLRASLARDRRAG